MTFNSLLIRKTADVGLYGPRPNSFFCVYVS